MTAEAALQFYASTEDLERDRDRSTDEWRAFVERRLATEQPIYRREADAAAARFASLLDRTNDLRHLAVYDATELELTVARYLVAPPGISNDDLKIVAAGLRGQARRQAGLALIARFVDPIWFPWLAEGRAPTEQERSDAIRWAASLFAAQKVGTERRLSLSGRQEAATRVACEHAGYILGDGHHLAPGEFGKETNFGGNKADTPVRLHSGRFLLLEEKVSGSEVNSYKRLGHEVTDKLTKWHEVIEDALVGTVLAGVYNAHVLAEARSAGVLVFWEHDLDRLTQFIQIADAA